MWKHIAKIIIALINIAGGIVVALIAARYTNIPFPNKALQQEVSDLKQAKQELINRLDNRSRLVGDFEWQWSGDNWIGSVTFQKVGDGKTTAALDMRSVKPDPRTQFTTLRITPMYSSVVPGSVTIDDQSKITLNLPVQVTSEYLKSHHTVSKTVVLDAELQPVDAFAGRVRYQGDEPKPLTGDVILVRYRSDARNW